MSGNHDGAIKASETNRKRHGADFYKRIGAQSWKNPGRSRMTGFALMPIEQVVAYGSMGGKKTKSDYTTSESETQDVTRQVENLNASVSE